MEVQKFKSINFGSWTFASLKYVKYEKYKFWKLDVCKFEIFEVRKCECLKDENEMFDSNIWKSKIVKV